MKYLFQYRYVRLSIMDEKLNIYHAHYFMSLYKFDVNTNTIKKILFWVLCILRYARCFTQFKWNVSLKRQFELIMKECHKKKLYCILHRLQDVFLLHCYVILFIDTCGDWSLCLWVDSPKQCDRSSTRKY